jgi:glycosyltransferase involved in cell wall biosynthesis
MLSSERFGRITMIQNQMQNDDTRAALVTNIPTPYRLPMWDHLHRRCDLEVFCIASQEKNRHWRVEDRAFVSFLSSFQIPFARRDWFVHITLPLSLFVRLVRSSPDVVIVTGYDSVAYWEALLYTKLFRKKCVFWNGSTLLSSRSVSKLIRRLKSLFIRRFDAYYTYGSRATEYLKSFGVSPEAIVTGTNTVDTAYFKREINGGTTPYEAGRKLLFVGQLIGRKGLANTLHALKQIETDPWHLTVIGDGSQREQLAALAEELGLARRVDFVGYLDKEAMIGYYYRSDILLMPSLVEVWGLVVNEALCAGLYCVVSKYAGAGYDLIEEGRNGVLVDPREIDAFADVLCGVLRQDFDKHAIQSAFEVDTASEAAKLYKAVQLAQKGGS